MAEKLTKARQAGALRDIERNNGTMWEPATGFNARLLWDEIKREGLVDWCEWRGRYVPSAAGRLALENTDDR